MINVEIESFDWEKSFEGKTVYAWIYIIILSIIFIRNEFHNFISSTIIKCNEKDQLWFHYEIQQIANEKNKLFLQFIKNLKSQSDYD